MNQPRIKAAILGQLLYFVCGVLTVGHYDSQPIAVMAHTVVCMGIWNRVCVCVGVCVCGICCGRWTNGGAGIAQLSPHLCMLCIYR